MRSSSLRVCSAWFVETSFKFGIFMLMLRICVRNWCACWAYASGTDAHAKHTYQHAQGTHQFLVRMLSIFWRECALCTHKYLMCMLGARTSSWLVCSAYASVPDAHAQCTHQFLMRMLRVYKMNIWKIWKLMRMLSMRIRNWCISSVPDAHAQGAHQLLTRMLSVRIKVWACA